MLEWPMFFVHKKRHYENQTCHFLFSGSYLAFSCWLYSRMSLMTFHGYITCPFPHLWCVLCLLKQHIEFLHLFTALHSWLTSFTIVMCMTPSLALWFWPRVDLVFVLCLPYFDFLVHYFYLQFLCVSGFSCKIMVKTKPEYCKLMWGGGDDSRDRDKNVPQNRGKKKTWSPSVNGPLLLLL